MHDTARNGLCAVVAMMSAGAALAADPSGTGAPAASGLMAKVPIKLGYYVNEGEQCSRPTSVMKFGHNSVWNIYEDDAGETKLASVSRQDGGYWLQFAGEFEEQDPQGIQLSSKGPGRIEVTIQDTALMHHCSPQELPASFRK